MRRHRAAWLLFLLLTLINVAVFLFRDRFQYIPYASRADLYGSCNANCERRWKQFADDYPASELAAARRLTDSLTSGKVGTFLRVRAIGAFLYAKFHRQLGTSAPGLSQVSPWKQYQRLSQDTSLQLWCGNLAQVFSWLCWSQGIVTRTIEIMHPGNRHVLNEWYFPETGSWVVTDLTHNIIMAEGSKLLLDAMQFRDRVRTARPSGITYWVDSVVAFKEEHPDSTSYRTFYSGDDPLFYYERVDNSQVYSLGNRIRSYFLPVSWYAILGKGNNTAFYLKEVCLFLWMLLLAYLAWRTKFRV